MFPWTELLVISISIGCIILKKLQNCNPEPILNVYQRPNGFYWVKVAFMYIILATRKLIHRIKSSLKKDKSEEYEELDKIQPFSDHPQAIDAVYFNGASKNGDFFIIATARRKEQLVDSFFYLLIKESGLGLLESPKLPSTSLYQNRDIDEYGAEGIKISCITPMEEWKISYIGKMKKHGTNEEVDVKVSATWTSDLPVFNFDTDMNPLAMAKSMAYEKFSRDYFENLKKSHQTHYEQHGDIKSVVVVNEKTYVVDLNALRDHSFGMRREWRMFHRYGLHFLTTENGDRINVGMICLPISFSRLTIGYVYSSEDKKIYPVESCDLQLYQHGENADPPRDYAFQFRAGGKTYTVQVNVMHSPHFYISKDWESKIFEGLSQFEVNGVKGWGAAEWQYRNADGKNVPDYNGN